MRDRNTPNTAREERRSLERRIDELENRYDEQFLLVVMAIHALAQEPTQTKRPFGLHL